MNHTCDTCHEPVGADVAFVRSVNLRTVAWCRACWVARHEDLRIPAQRESARPAAPRRWVLTRR